MLVEAIAGRADRCVPGFGVCVPDVLVEVGLMLDVCCGRGRESGGGGNLKVGFFCGHRASLGVGRG